MSGSNPPPSQPYAQQQQQHDVRSSPLQQSRAHLPFEEIVKLFSVPIVEAASILGVCTSVLKRRCRENGISKWPYRKIHAGKSVEDVKKDAISERELSRLGRMESPVLASSALATNLQEISRDQLQQGSKLVQTERTNVARSVQLRNIPSFFDEFKYGFPANGLSSATNKWWGTSEDGGKGNALKKEMVSVDDEHRATLDEEVDSRSEDSSVLPQHASRLVSLRKQAAKDGRESLGLGDSQGHGSYKLSKREELVLQQVFESYMPSQWNDNLP